LFVEDAFRYYYESSPYDYGSFFGEYSSSNGATSASVHAAVEDWTLSCTQKAILFIKKRHVLTYNYKKLFFFVFLKVETNFLSCFFGAVIYSLLASSNGVKLGCKIVTYSINYCRLYVTDAQEKLQVLVSFITVNNFTFPS
jgi:hypothetical protein